MNSEFFQAAIAAVGLAMLLSGCSGNISKADREPNKSLYQTTAVKKVEPVNLIQPKVVKPAVLPKPATVKKAVMNKKANVTKRHGITRNWGMRRSATLTGDFSGNPQASAFIDQMVAKHGFDRGYLNYVFSNTRATPFLKKMAYKDAYPGLRSGKSRKGSWTRYRNLFLTESTIQQGMQFWKQNRVALRKAEQKYGVPEEYILGIIGVETRYGGNVGKNRAIDALATMGFNNPRRGKYFRSELESYLLMARENRMDPLQPMSSYAGALGLCQFMPSNIGRYGVDHDRNGKCNLWAASDAIGSVANYFKNHGWRPGEPVAVKAAIEGNQYRNLKSSYKRTHSLSRMEMHGVYPQGHIGNKVRFLRMSTYSGDEVWLAAHNFYVITRYNHSSKYALAVHQLAQAYKSRIRGIPTRMASLNDARAYR